MLIYKTSSMCALGFVMSATFIPAQDIAAQDWEWMVTPYVWGSGTSVDIFANDNQLIGGELDFSGLVDKIDFAGLVHVEGRKGNFGLLFDLIYMDTGDSVTLSGRPLLPDGTIIATDARTTLIELGGFYRPSGEQHGFDLLFGARVMDMSVDLDITVPTPATERVSSSDTLTDGFLGMRYSAPLAENWFMSVRGDAGTGDSDLSWNASAIVGYTFGKNKQYDFLFGYRHFVVELKDTVEDVRIEVDLTMSGPAIGFAFNF